MKPTAGGVASQRPAVSVRGVSKSYGERVVLADVDLDIAEGERFCLVGHNGSGKTTLLELIMGIRQPSGGEIRVLGLSPAAPSLRPLRGIMVARPSYPYYAKVKEVVWLYSAFQGNAAQPAGRPEEFGLDGHRYVRHLSTGQLRRLALLLALLGDPRLILLDEPASGLDPQARLKLWQLLAPRPDRPPTTVLFSTHDLSEADRFADRVGILHHGRLVAVDTVGELCRATIGAARKITLPPAAAERWWRGDGQRFSPVRFGGEVAVYTDHPEEVLRELEMGNGALEYRVERVSLRDVFFRLTGEVPDGPAVAGPAGAG